MKRLLAPTAVALATSLFAASESRADDDVLGPQEPALASPESTPPPETTTPPPPQNPHLRRMNLFRLEGGFAPRYLFELPVMGGEIGGGFAFERRWIVHAVSMTGTFGSTENGLAVRSGHILYDAEFIPFDRFRIGLGVGLMFVSVDRSARDDALTSIGLSLRASARVDVARPDGFTLFARGSLGCGLAFEGQETCFWGPSVGLGVDFDLGINARKR